MVDLYEILGVDKSASQDEIKDAFREKAKRNHTDKGGDNDKMVELNRAYGVLKSEKSRERYDKTGKEEDVPFELRFQELVQVAFLRIVDETADVERVDLLAQTRKYVKLIIKETTNNKGVIEKKYLKLQKVLDRVVAKKENRIGNVLEMNLRDLKGQIGALDDNVKFLGEALECLEHYDYRFDETPVADTKEEYLNRFFNITA